MLNSLDGTVPRSVGKIIKESNEGSVRSRFGEGTVGFNEVVFGGVPRAGSSFGWHDGKG